jgi:putative ABC transport system permease protein
MRPFAIRKNKKIYSNQYDMFQNYFKIGIRNLLKNKFFSFINITGMAISMAIVVIIYLYIQDEFSFDKHLDDLHLKYRVFNEHFSDDGNIRKGAMVPPMIGPAMAAEYPQVDFYTRFLNFNAATLFEVGDKRFTERDGGSADGTIFRMFNLTLLEGDPNTALSEPNSVAINTALKKKYFGDGPALGKSIEIFDQHFKVVAVFEDFPEHSHFKRNYFLSMQMLKLSMPASRISLNATHGPSQNQTVVTTFLT